MELTEEHEQQAIEKILRLRSQRSLTNWSIPDEYAAKAFEIAETASQSPAQALLDASNFIDGLRKRNLVRQTKLSQARKLRADLIALEDERSPRKPEKAKVKETPSSAQPTAPGWLSRWLNGATSEVASKDVKDDVDEASIMAIQEEGGEGDRGLMNSLPEGGSQPAAPVANAETTAVDRSPRGCLRILPFVYRRKQNAAAATVDPTAHGISLPLTNAGSRGLQGLFQRWLLTTLNATPTSGLNWMEVTKDGLQIYQPLATVSQRAIKHKQVRDGQVVLSVNPPAYFDSFLGILRQFRRDVDTPWGEIVIYEGGSGRVIASAIALAPGKKLKQIRNALELLHLAENEAEGFRRIPQLQDLLIYVDEEPLREREQTGAI